MPGHVNEQQYTVQYIVLYTVHNFYILRNKPKPKYVNNFCIQCTVCCTLSTVHTVLVQREYTKIIYIKLLSVCKLIYILRFWFNSQYVKKLCTHVTSSINYDYFSFLIFFFFIRKEKMIPLYLESKFLSMRFLLTNELL